jgi:hypothetical protein
MSGTKLISALLSGVFVAGNAAAADRCTSSDAARTLKVAELQEQLMVAALTCHDVRDYNRFVLSYRPALQASDRAMLRFFKGQDGAGAGDRAYNAFKTRLANVSALNSNADNAAFCGNAADEFNAAFEGQVSLAQLAMSEPAYVALPIAGCSDAVETANVAPRPAPAAPPADPDAAPHAVLPREASSEEDGSRRDGDDRDSEPRQARGYDMPDSVYRDGPPPPRDARDDDDSPDDGN